MCPEFPTDRIVTQKSDAYAFGVVLLELMSSEEAFKYRYVRKRGDYERISVVETAAKAVEKAAGGILLRRWMDLRMKDSYPIDVAEKMVQKIVYLALECVHVEAAKRPNMTLVAGKISKLFLTPRKWVERMQLPTNAWDQRVEGQSPKMKTKGAGSGSLSVSQTLPKTKVNGRRAERM